MARMLTVPSHLEITIRRPSGQIEVITHPKFQQISDNGFAQIRAANLAAGRGECLSYRNVTKEVPEPAEWAALAAAEKAYDDSTRAIYRAMDAEYEGPARDKTPTHKSDM